MTSSKVAYAHATGSNKMVGKLFQIYYGKAQWPQDDSQGKDEFKQATLDHNDWIINDDYTTEMFTTFTTISFKLMFIF